MVALPLPFAVTSPFVLTEAMAMSDDDQAKVTPRIVAPLESFAAAESCAVASMLVSAAEAPLTSTPAMAGAFGSTVAEGLPPQATIKTKSAACRMALL
jgi:hypothetical protein